MDETSSHPLCCDLTSQVIRRIMSEESDEECCIGIGGDILEEIISHIPLVDLVSANNVSSAWRSAISTSLLRLNTVKPWLMIHSTVTTLAYDPRSHLWMEFQLFQQQPPFSPLRSSHSSLLYMLSATQFTFSIDPLHLHWQQPTVPPITWRPDPVVAAVGNRIIVAGAGIPDHDTIPPLEIYDTTTHTWECCDSIPTELMDSAASTWLSVAADQHQNKMYVSVKSSGVTYSFDPMAKTWCGPYEVRADVEGLFYSVIGSNGSGMVIAVGLTGEAEDVRSVVMWEVKDGGKKWKMPFELTEKMKGDRCGYMPSISLNVMGDFVFVHNPLEVREVIVCQLLPAANVNGGTTCRWGSVTATALDDDACRFRNLVLSCSDVTLPHLERAIKLGTQRFSLNTLF